MVSKQKVVIEHELLDEYEVGDFFIETPKRTILGKGVYMHVPTGEPHQNQMEGLSDRVASVLKKAKEQGHLRSVVTGAVPFDYYKKHVYLFRNLSKSHHHCSRRKGQCPVQHQLLSIGSYPIHHQSTIS